MALFWLPVPAFCVAGVYVHLLLLCRGGYLLFLSAVLEGLCVLPKFACLPSMTPEARTLRRLCCLQSHSATWARPSVLQGLCALAGFGYAHPSRFCEPAYVWGHSA